MHLTAGAGGRWWALVGGRCGGSGGAATATEPGEEGGVLADGGRLRACACIVMSRFSVKVHTHGCSMAWDVRCT